VGGKRRAFSCEGASVSERCRSKRRQVYCTAFFACEVDSAIRKRVFDGKMASAEAQKAYAILDAAPVAIVDVSSMRQRAREIAEQFNQRAVYDATYVALAESRGCEFWTADKLIYDAVKATLPYVKYLPDYP
jgi:predicted nucleic acid-binding protein